MNYAINLAKLSFNNKEIPVGCVIVNDNQIIGESHNLVQTHQDPTSHAEMIAIKQAVLTRKNKYLDDCVAYVTLEPCVMCMGAFLHAHLPKLVYGAYDTQRGACGSVADLSHHWYMNHHIEIISGFMEKECEDLLRCFFKSIR